jgi:8-oxo-dGTP pyrophosphatase MutT (NUDIX family)/nicotinamide mononucleotide adenylyltransferase
MEKRIVGTIGRYRILHKGHKEYLCNLARDYDKVVICIGSCFEHGTNKNCILPIFVEKMIRAIYEEEKIDKDKFIIHCMSDYDQFDDWFEALLNLFKKHNVTHFATGNKEDILSVLTKKGYNQLQIINPEDESNFPYHASDVRKAIIDGNYELLNDLIPYEVQSIVFGSPVFQSVIDANKGRAVPFIKGRQTVDLICFIKNIADNELYILGGKRNSNKQDFPGLYGLPGGAMELYETAYQTAVRSLKEKTNLEIDIIKNSFEPAVIQIANVKAPIAFMKFVGLYSTDNKLYAGTNGGSSQCFATLIEDNIEKYQDVIKSSKELEEVAFYKVNDFLDKEIAYQQKDMIIDALNLLNAYPLLNDQQKIMYKRK